MRVLKCSSLSELEGGSDWAVHLDLAVLVLWGGTWAFFLKAFLDAVSLKIVAMIRDRDCGEKEAALFLSLRNFSIMFSSPPTHQIRVKMELFTSK